MPNVEQCPHAWTLRYWADGKQRERSFKDEIRQGRTIYGSGRKLAQDAHLKLTVDKRAGDRTFADYSKAGRRTSGKRLRRSSCGSRSRPVAQFHLSAYRYARQAARSADQHAARVAGDRDGVLGPAHGHHERAEHFRPRATRG